MFEDQHCMKMVGRFFYMNCEFCKGIYTFDKNMYEIKQQYEYWNNELFYYSKIY